MYWAHYNSPQSFIKQLRTIIDPIRKDDFEKDNSFDGSFDEDSQTQSVPTRLLILISFLHFGSCEGTSSFCRATLTCAQYIMSNCKKQRKNDISPYPSRMRETPVLIYISLLIYATVRSRVLIEKLFHLGICIPYQRVLGITKHLYDELRTSFTINGAFLPAILKRGLFTKQSIFTKMKIIRDI